MIIVLPPVLFALAGCISVPSPGQNGFAPAAAKIDFTEDAVISAQASGQTRPGGDEATPEARVRIASISKLAVALAVMRLSDKGVLDLDRDVNDYLEWDVRHPGFPGRPVTLRMLLSHTSSLADGAGYALPLDGLLADNLDDPGAWDDAHAPGSYFRYANVNYPLIAAVMESATGKRFDHIMRDEIFAPLDLDACFNWQGCLGADDSDIVTLTRPDGRIARDDMAAERACPFVPASNGSCDPALYPLGRNGSSYSPQGGMRISATGLARIGQVLLNDGEPLLSRQAFAEMTRAEWVYDGNNGEDDNGYFRSFGLGVHILEDETGARWIGHSGDAYSLRAGLWVQPETRRGIAQYVTGVAEDHKPGHCLAACP